MPTNFSARNASGEAINRLPVKRCVEWRPHPLEQDLPARIGIACVVSRYDHRPVGQLPVDHERAF